MSLSTAQQTNFETLCRAVRNGDVLLMECQLVTTSEPVPIVCIVNQESDGNQILVPCAQLFTANPYTLVNPPHPERPGFATQSEVWGTADT